MNSNGCARLTYFQASIAFDKDMKTQECPNRTFFPVSCRSPFHICNRVPIRRTLSPTERVFGHLLGSKKKEALMVRSCSFDHSVAATCVSDPSNYMLVSFANTCQEFTPLDSFGLLHFLTVAKMLKSKSLRAFESPVSSHSLIASESGVNTKSEYSDFPIKCVRLQIAFISATVVFWLEFRHRFTPAPGA